ncbi:ribonuclease H-like domain-containing protein [Tanacetum coccineum]
MLEGHITTTSATKTRISTVNPVWGSLGVIDSSFSRHMTGNMSYLTDYEDIDGGYVAIVGNPKGGKITCRDHLGKFDGKADEGFFVGYSINSKAFRVFNSRTRIVKENLHVQFSENTPNIVGSRPNWLFDIDALTKSMNYKPVVTADPPFSQISKSSPDAGFQPSSDDGKKVDEDSRNNEGIDQEKKDNVSNTNNVNAANTNEVNAVYDDEDVGAKADMNNLDAFMLVRPIPTTRVHKRIIPGYTLEEGIDYDEVFASVARIEAIRLFLAYASFKDFVVYQMDVKSDFLYAKIEEEVYVCQPLGFEDPDFPDRMRSMGELAFFLGLQVKQKEDGIFINQDNYVTEILKKFGFTDVKTISTPMETQKLLLKDEDGEEVDVHLYRSMIGSLMYLTSSRPDIMFAVSYTDSDYVGVSLDRKSTIGGCQFLGCRLISWQCKKQTVVANSTTEAEYVAASSCCRQVLWIKNQLLDYGDCNEKKLIQMVKIHTDKNVADLLTKAFDVSKNSQLLLKVNAARHKLTTADES